MIFFDKYCLRALEPSDLEALYFWENKRSSYNNHEQFYSRYTLSNYIEQAHQSLIEAKQFRFVISLKDKLDVCIGFIDLVDYDVMHQRLEVGILIDSKYRGQSIAKRGLLEVEQYVKNVFQVQQVYCYVELENVISLKLFESLNYKKVGVLEKWRRYDDQWNDCVFLQKIL